MSDRSISFRLTSETAKLYDEYRQKWDLDDISDSQIIRAGLTFLMAMPEMIDNDEVSKIMQENYHIQSEIKKIIQKHPDPNLYDLWKRFMENLDKLEVAMEKSTEKFLDVVGDGQKGRKPANKKHTPGRISDKKKGYGT